MILIFLGAPGAGKGTQAKILSAKYGFKHLATGDILRGEIAEKSALGLKAAELVHNGILVDDALMTQMVAGRLDASSRGHLLDGFPRNLVQAEALAKLLGSRKTSIDAVFYFHLAHQEALKRLSSRRVCSSCQAAFNLVSKPPKSADKCDFCGAALVQREDDKEATAAKRLMVFEDITSPLVAYYKAEQDFYELDASQAPEKVTEVICGLVDALMAGKPG